MIANGGAVGLTPGLERVSYTKLLPASAWPAVVRALLAENLSPVVFRHRHPEPPLFRIQSRSGYPRFEPRRGDLIRAVGIEIAMPVGALADRDSRRECVHGPISVLHQKQIAPFGNSGILYP